MITLWLGMNYSCMYTIIIIIISCIFATLGIKNVSNLKCHISDNVSFRELRPQIEPDEEHLLFGPPPCIVKQHPSVAPRRRRKSDRAWRRLLCTFVFNITLAFKATNDFNGQAGIGLAAHEMSQAYRDPTCSETYQQRRRYLKARSRNRRFYFIMCESLTCEA